MANTLTFAACILSQRECMYISTNVHMKYFQGFSGIAPESGIVMHQKQEHHSFRK